MTRSRLRLFFFRQEWALELRSSLRHLVLETQLKQHFFRLCPLIKQGSNQTMLEESTLLKVRSWSKLLQRLCSLTFLLLWRSRSLQSRWLSGEVRQLQRHELR